MTAADEQKPWLRAKIEALLHSEWLGKPGQWFRRTAEAVEKFDADHVHIEDKIQRAPEVGWNTLQIKSSQTELNLAQAEEKKIAAVLAQRTLAAKTRQEEAAADLAETNARMAKTQELQGRLKLFADLRDANCIPIWDANGNMTVIPAPAGCNWDELKKSLLQIDTLMPTGFTITQTQ